MGMPAENMVKRREVMFSTKLYKKFCILYKKFCIFKVFLKNKPGFFYKKQKIPTWIFYKFGN